MELESLYIFKMKETKKTMTWLGKRKETIFLGQTVCYPGSPMFASFENVPKEKKIEFPVTEDMQMGVSIGLALEGKIPISVFPRMDFLICAINQLVNHLDKVKQTSNNEFNPGVIIRTKIGSSKPLYPGHQHCGDYTKMLRAGLKNTRVIKLNKVENLLKEYQTAYKFAKNSGISTILIEMP